MIQRIVTPSQSHSYFLFGPRGTGKSTLLDSYYANDEALFIDLLDPEEEDTFSRNPRELTNRIATLKGKKTPVIIDEIQKVPKLLDIVQQTIVKTGRRFVLTGSSARKLKRGGANLLAGRAFVYHLHPFTHRELKHRFHLDEALRWGTLPELLTLDAENDKSQFLRSYALMYLREEITLEQLVRNLDPFRRFLEIAAQSNGKIINYTRISEDIGVDVKTTQSYFKILEDTLIGFFLPAFHESIRKQQRSAPKFFLFDTGVKKALERTLHIPIQEGTYSFGDAFEHFIILELIRFNDYFQKDWALSYLRTKDNLEIDCIIDRPGMNRALLEIKSTTTITERDVAPLNRIAGDFSRADSYCISRDKHDKKIGTTWCLHWKKGLRELCGEG